MKRIFALYDDGNHIGCFETYQEAESYMISNDLRMGEIEEEDFEPDCDCKNNRISQLQAEFNARCNEEQKIKGNDAL